MFTGIIEELGQVVENQRRGSSARLRIHCRRVLEDADLGSSLAVNGVCLTVVDRQADGFAADLGAETLARTNLGRLAPGDLVNLERPLQLSSRLSGHLVQGHVDGLAEVRTVTPLNAENWELQIALPPELARYTVYKGSIALDGVSLTIARLEGCILSISIIPHTWTNTIIHRYQSGDVVNVECDLIAKYVERLLTDSGAIRPPS
jgi:riboflavin synthase